MKCLWDNLKFFIIYGIAHLGNQWGPPSCWTCRFGYSYCWEMGLGDTYVLLFLAVKSMQNHTFCPPTIKTVAVLTSARNSHLLCITSGMSRKPLLKINNWALNSPGMYCYSKCYRSPILRNYCTISSAGPGFELKCCVWLLVGRIMNSWVWCSWSSRRSGRSRELLNLNMRGVICIKEFSWKGRE